MDFESITNYKKNVFFKGHIKVSLLVNCSKKRVFMGFRVCMQDPKSFKRQKLLAFGTSLVVQWLRLCAFTVEDTGSNPDWGTKIPNASWGGLYMCVYIYISIRCGEGNGTPLQYSCLENPMPAWRIPWTEEPGRLQFMESWRVGHDWATSLSLFTFMHWRRKWQPTPVFLPGKSQGRGNLVGCRLWGPTESTWLTRLSSSSSIRCHSIPIPGWKKRQSIACVRSNVMTSSIRQKYPF